MTSIHLSGHAKRENGITGLKKSETGKTVISEYREAALIAGKLRHSNHPCNEISPALIYGVSLLDEVFSFLINSYLSTAGGSFTGECYSRMEEDLGPVEMGKFLRGYSDTFETENEIIEGSREFLKDLITLGTGYHNKAYLPFRDLFFSRESNQNKRMLKIYSALESHFEKEPGFGPESISLIRFLQIPSEKAPGSVMAQLSYIAENWGDLIGNLRSKLLTGLDRLKEETKVRLQGSGPAVPYTFSPGEDPENFSRDRDWMSSLVLLAKSTLVWLSQLSSDYHREITRIDQIPDEELDRISSRGFTGLWLIGLWERSSASAEIKQRTGNPEAAASAYSINDYKISKELGGEEAFQSLKERALSRGIRLAADMVPNHMGIDSKWVLENPHWFISSEHPPFEGYTFNGPNLCSHPGHTIHLEDHYYTKTDAAVVFEHRDHHSGERQYVYHGNDGTSMPWNDTAQLNYLSGEVRRHVIDTILEIAGKFNIIRFDAAMILAKQHFQRLWFPEPGHGGDIPSRAGRGVTGEEFHRAFPKEFWKEVVENIAEKAPDTLLLAEAFWMMEPYFVRTLGMHRVYNSAFMNFLKTEGNREFRLSIKNTIEFNPEILKRFANFMNNPDEETAVEQFGSDDKYFGVCTLLATLPGLPMFGHGQIEGFREKYGMEYRKAYKDESPDQVLLHRHQREIFPLLKRRNIFSHSGNFRLYDFRTDSGDVIEDVIAYSNRYENKYSLIVYNNRYAEYSGRIHTSSPFVELTPGGEKNQITSTIGGSLDLGSSGNEFIVFRDFASSLQYIRKSSEILEEGFFFKLGAFKYHSFLDFHRLTDTAGGKYARLHTYLNGNGTENIEKLFNVEIGNPLWEPLRDMFQKHSFFLNCEMAPQDDDNMKESLKMLFAALVPGIPEEKLTGLMGKVKKKTENSLLYLNSAGTEYTDPVSMALVPALVLSDVGKFLSTEHPDDTDRPLDRFFIRDVLEKLYQEAHPLPLSPDQFSLLVILAVNYSELYMEIKKKSWDTPMVEEFLSDPDLKSLLGVNEYENVIWYTSDLYRSLNRLLLTMTGGELEEIYRKFIQADSKSENHFHRLKKYILGGTEN